MPDSSSTEPTFIACPECDLLQRVPGSRSVSQVSCGRCRYVLYRPGVDLVNTPLALALTALVLFVVSNAFPLLDVNLQGRQESTYLLGGIEQLFHQGRPLLALVVLFTTLLAPSAHIMLLIYLFLPLSMGRRPPGFAQALRLASAVVPWSMLEIFLLGVLVSTVKLAEQAVIAPGPGAWGLAALILALAAASTRVHPHRLWDRLA